MNEEYLIDLNEEHQVMLKKLYSYIDDNIINILDCGSGKTSLSSLLINYSEANVDAIVYTDDSRKIESIKDNIKSERYNLITMDICEQKIEKNYDLVLAHLLLGESNKFGNTFKDVLESLLTIKTKYLIIVDFLEDKSIYYEYMEESIKRTGYSIILKNITKKKNSQKFIDFEGENYIAYLLKREV